MPDDVRVSNLKVVGSRPVRPDGVDKVTGRAKFGADFNMPNQLVGQVLRSPHAHAIIKSIDISKAEALKGVKAVVTRDDFEDMPSELAPAGEMLINYKDMTRNIIAREKALYDGHAVAAVAATSASVARRAVKLIEVDYEVLPHVIDPVPAMAKDAPILHDDMITEGVDPAPTEPSNIAKRVEFGCGDVETGFAEADIIIEREFDTKAVHQGYIETHACVANYSEDGSADLWCTTQGHFVVRGHCAKLVGMDVSRLRVTSSEIGGGFGGKTVVYLEPLALMLSKKCHHPVKMIMSRDDVMRATGPTSGANIWVKMGVKNNGVIVAGEAILKYQAGAFAGSPVQPGCMCAFAPYDLQNVKVVGFDVVTNRPKVAAYRAPGAPISEYAVECVVDELAEKLNIDPVEFRQKNEAKEGTRAAYGPKFGPIGYPEILEQAKALEQYNTPLSLNQGRGVASGFWFNIGGESCAALQLNVDGTLNLMIGTPDIGGSRASMALMAAETLGVDYDDVRPIIGDTSSLGYTFLTGGSRATFSSGMAVVQASEDIIKQACARAAKVWEIDVEAVTWENGLIKPSGPNAGDFEPMTLADIAKHANKTGGPIAGHAQINAQGAAPSFGLHVVDVEVDPDTCKVDILRYTVLQDAGKAIHPAYVEGQFQGGAAQGIGWALNEEYIYNDKGQMENTGFLDYRIPVCSDLPMIDTVIVEEPNPRHPFGVRGIGETPIIPPMAAVANAISRATGIRFSELPMSPPRILAKLDEMKVAAE